MNDWKIGDRFLWFDKTYCILHINNRKKTLDIGEPYKDVFGKEAFITRRVFHIRDMVHVRKIEES